MNTERLKALYELGQTVSHARGEKQPERLTDPKPSQSAELRGYVEQSSQKREGLVKPLKEGSNDISADGIIDLKDSNPGSEIWLQTGGPWCDCILYDSEGTNAGIIDRWLLPEDVAEELIDSGEVDEIT